MAAMVSVIVPFHNAEAFLAETVRSVLEQTYQSWELHLVDDGSVDGGPDIAHRFTQIDSRISYVRATDRRLGISATRSVGLRRARGDLVALLDSDDVWFSGKLEEQVELLAANPDVALLYGRSEYWRSWAEGSPATVDFTPELGVEPWRVIEPPELLLRLYPLGPGNAPAVSSIVFRRSLLETTGGFEDQMSDAYDDQGFLAKAYLVAPVLAADRIWDRYRQHDRSVSSAIEREGGYLDARRAFLTWLSNYLGRQRDVDDRVKRALDAALFLAGDPDAPPTPVSEVDEVVTRPSPTLVGANLELPPVGRLAVRALTIGGWVLGRSAPAKVVEVQQDGRTIRSIPVDRSRADIEEAFPDTPGAAGSGFVGHVDCFALRPGLLDVKAVLVDSEVTDVGKIAVR